MYLARACLTEVILVSNSHFSRVVRSVSVGCHWVNGSSFTRHKLSCREIIHKIIFKSALTGVWLAERGHFHWELHIDLVYRSSEFQISSPQRGDSEANSKILNTNHMEWYLTFSQVFMKVVLLEERKSVFFVSICVKHLEIGNLKLTDCLTLTASHFQQDLQLTRKLQHIIKTLKIRFYKKNWH